MRRLYLTGTSETVTDHKVIWKRVSGTMTLRRGLKGIVPSEPSVWVAAAESASCPACSAANYIPEIEQNWGFFTRSDMLHRHTSADSYYIMFGALYSGEKDTRHVKKYIMASKQKMSHYTWESSNLSPHLFLAPKPAWHILAVSQFLHFLPSGAFLSHPSAT